MPHCTKFINKATGEPDTFSIIDDKVCEHFGVEPREDEFYYNWYDTIALLAAMGKNWMDIQDKVSDNEKLLQISQFLADHYDIKAWREFK